MSRKTLLFLLLVLLVGEACTIQKRRYLKGFHVQRVFSFPSHAKGDISEAAVVDGPKTITSSDPATAWTVIQKQDSLPAIVPVVNEIRFPLVEASEKAEKIPDILVARETEQAFKQNIQQPLLLKPSISLQPVYGSSWDGWNLLVLLVILAGLILPPLLNFFLDKILFVVLNIVVWAAGVVCIVLLAPTVGLTVLFILLWHILFSVLFFAIYI